METNNTNTSVATPLFSWGDYWKTFAWLFMGFLLLGIVEALVGAYSNRNSFYEPSPFLVFYPFLVPTLIMGEAFLALIFSKIKNGGAGGFLLHAWAYVALAVLLDSLSIILFIGDDMGVLVPTIFIVGILASILFFFYSLVRLRRWKISCQNDPNKSFSLTFVRWFLAHAIKIYVVLGIFVALGSV